MMVDVRFQASQVHDAIERHLSTDPMIAAAVVDLAEVVRLADLDGGRPASLLRLGFAVDALARQLGDDSAALYPVVERGLLSDADLTANERMVIRRWSDDGLVEVLPAGTPALRRAVEIGELTGLSVISRSPLPAAASAGYTLVPAPGGAALEPQSGAGGSGPAPRGRHPALGRWWRCPVPDCASFGQHAAGHSPPLLARGVPTCPRHGERLGGARGVARGVHVGINRRHLGVEPFVGAVSQATVAVDLPHVGHAPAHPRRLAQLDLVGIALVADHVGGHDHQQFGPLSLLVIVTEQSADDRNLRNARHAALDHLVAVGNQAAEAHRLPVERADRRLRQRDIDPRLADHLAAGAEADRNAFGERSDL